MKSVPQFPRLTRRDCERLLDVHQQLNRVYDTLERSSWTGGRASAGGIMSALVLISDLYNRAEQAFLRGADPPPASPFHPGQPGLTEVTVDAIVGKPPDQTSEEQ
jgi:hypothetical protein